jgi:hypothetical protein
MWFSRRIESGLTWPKACSYEIESRAPAKRKGSAEARHLEFPPPLRPAPALLGDFTRAASRPRFDAAGLELVPE